MGCLLLQIITLLFSCFIFFPFHNLKGLYFQKGANLIECLRCDNLMVAQFTDGSRLYE